jgi:hypothetical protein
MERRSRWALVGPLGLRRACAPKRDDRPANGRRDPPRAHERQHDGDEKRHRGFGAEHFATHDREAQPADGDDPCEQHPGSVVPRSRSLFPLPQDLRLVDLGNVRCRFCAARAPGWKPQNLSPRFDSKISMTIHRDISGLRRRARGLKPIT